MNCLEYRRQITAEPTVESAEGRAHRGQCEACTSFARGMRAQEAALLSALNVNIPDTLAAKILFSQRLAQSKDAQFEAELAQAVNIDWPSSLASRILARVRQLSRVRQISNIIPLRLRTSTLIQFALAASIAVAVAAGSLLALGQSDERLVDRAIAHVDHEQWMFERNEPLPMDLVRPVARMAGIEMTELPGKVTLVYPCPWDNKRNFHFVMVGTHDKVTVMVMPGQYVDAHQSASARRYSAVVIPVRNGSLAVVGHPQENLKSHAEQVRKVLRWRL
ncbi:MAG: DUF3379 family protein [Gammaproteobacteria bacterium]|nr:DUF3379 family protein [Gammaproteobacteria bacterium]